MSPDNFNGCFKMAASHKQKSHKQMKQDNTQSKECDGHSVFSVNKLNNKSIKSELYHNLNSSIFAMLLQRTTFTIVLVLLSCTTVLSAEVSNSSTRGKLPIEYEKITLEENGINVRPTNEEATKLTPVYIPLTEPSKDEVTIEVEPDKETFKSRAFSNQTFDTGNKLWDGFLNECMAKPSVSCIQKNVYTYLDDSFGISGDVNVTDGFVFKKNKLAHWKYSEKANKKDQANMVDGEDFEGEEGREAEPGSPIEEVADALYGKGVSFLMGHDLELRLPETLFEGATLKVEPRGMEGDGALVKLDLVPRNSNGEGRIFFKKIKKFIKNKILLAVVVIIIVVKLIKLKLFIVLPLLLGIHNAKKLFLKLVLFVFPALGQIFKLCSWYHNNYHHTKYHHHHHQISHLHHSLPHVSAPVYGPPHHSGPVEVHHPGLVPPSSPSYQDSQDWSFSGPGLGPEYLSSNIHRNAIAGFDPKPDDANIINSWGLGAPSGSSLAASGTAPVYARPQASSFLDDTKIKQPDLNRKPQGPPLSAYASIKRPTIINPQAEKEALMRAAQKQAERLAHAQAEETLRKQALLGLKPKAGSNMVVHAAPPGLDSSSNPVFDPFYTPILRRVDHVFDGLAFHNEPCRERLVCSMYKNPQRYTPHSNLVSNELSRDASELQKPAPGSTDASRFYKYVQAARDGQEKKDCLRLYPQCSVDTERKKK